MTHTSPCVELIWTVLATNVIKRIYAFIVYPVWLVLIFRRLCAFRPIAAAGISRPPPVSFRSLQVSEVSLNCRAGIVFAS